MSENKKELVLNAFDGKSVSRVPVGFWFHFAKDESADGLADPSIIETNIAGHTKFVNSFKPDFVKLMSDGFFNYPNETLKNIKTVSDLKNIQPLPENHIWFKAQVELVKKQIAALPEDVATFYNLFAPSTTVKILLGVFDRSANTKLADLIEADENAVIHALDVIAGDIAKVAVSVIKEAGATGIYLSAQSIQDKRITEEVYKRVISPSELKILKAANEASEYNILHICGFEGSRNNLTWFKDYPAKAINWAVVVEGVSLSEGKKIFGGRTVIGGFGNTTNDVLYKGTKEEIQSETKRLLSESGRDSVIIGADCTVPRDIDLAHLEWVREAAK